MIKFRPPNSTSQPLFAIFSLNFAKTGLQIFSPWAEFSPWEINLCHSWDQCKSVEKKISIWGGGRGQNLLQTDLKIFLITKIQQFPWASPPATPPRVLCLDPNGGLRWPPNPRLHGRSLTRLRFSAPTDFVHLEACKTRIYPPPSPTFSELKIGDFLGLCVASLGFN